MFIIVFTGGTKFKCLPVGFNGMRIRRSQRREPSWFFHQKLLRFWMLPMTGLLWWLGGVPKTQARPRLGKCGFHNPNSKDMTAFRARIKGGIHGPPIFGSNQPVVVNMKFFMRRPNMHFKCNDRLNLLKTSLPTQDKLASCVCRCSGH